MHPDEHDTEYTPMSDEQRARLKFRYEARRAGAPANFWSDPDNERYYIEWMAERFTTPQLVAAIVNLSDGALEPYPAPAYDAPRLSTYPTRGICSRCGSQGCPHCADTDELTVLPPNDFDSWADLINSPIAE